MRNNDSSRKHTKWCELIEMTIHGSIRFAADYCAAKSDLFKFVAPKIACINIFLVVVNSNALCIHNKIFCRIYLNQYNNVNNIHMSSVAMFNPNESYALNFTANQCKYPFQKINLFCGNCMNPCLMQTHRFKCTAHCSQSKLVNC